MLKMKSIIPIATIGILSIPLNTNALTKNEAVYSKLNYDGSIYKTTVSNHLSWTTPGTLEDDSQLKEILNINGDETFEKKENKLSWQSLGEDIFYQGDTDKNLPINAQIKYYLNNEEKDAFEILGKEGNIKISIKFQNNLKNTIKVNHQNTELYTPFVTTIATMLDSSKNKNITINNGKIVSTGSRSMIVGLASPGLYDSMKLDNLKSLDEITITYETTSFSLNSIYIVSTPKLLEETDLNIFSKMDDLYNNMKELQKNMDLIEKGAKELEQGAHTLTTGSKELVSGLKSANDAAQKLKNGTNTLDNGLNQIINSLSTAQKELSKTNIENSLKELTTLKTQNTNAINTLIKKTNLKEADIATMYQKNKLQNYKGNDETLLNLKSTYEMILLLKANNTAIDTTTATLKTMNTKLNTLLNSLNQALSTAKNASIQLNNGMSELKSGINSLYLGSNNLNSGIQTLYNGTQSLYQGTSKLNKQGISKLNNYVGTLKNYSNKLEALTKLSKDYNGFTSNNSNNTQFISIVSTNKITEQR